MDIEYEATFTNIDKNRIRKMLRTAGAKLLKPEFLQKRVAFNLPLGHEIEGGWLRIRDEGGAVTLSLKVVNGKRIQDQKELKITIDDFKKGDSLLKAIGCRKKSYQETKRELWKLDDVEISLDEWPFLEPFLEIEGNNKAAVRNICRKIGLDFKQAIFCSADSLYSRKYKISEKIINNKIPKITFNSKNPFIN